MAEQWYVSRDGKQVGPMSLEQLQAAAAAGNVRPTDSVWKEGMAQWVVATEVGGLFPGAMASPYSSPAVPQQNYTSVPADNPDNAFGWYIRVLQKYAEFSGRARRKEYWFFNLFNLIINFALSFVGALVVKSTGIGAISLIGSIYSIAVIIPGIAVAVRRLHDTGRSGWWLLIAFIPLVGAIILLVFMVEDSNPGDNYYGPSPKMPGEI